MPLRVTANNLFDNNEQLAAQSKKVVGELEGLIFKIIDTLEAGFRKNSQKSFFFISSADLNSGVYYSPIFNLNKQLLGKITKQKKNTTLLREIRRIFLVNVGPTGFIRATCKTIRELEATTPTFEGEKIILIEVQNDGTISGEHCCFSDGEINEIPETLLETINSYGSVGNTVNDLLVSLRDSIEPRHGSVRSFLLFRPETAVSSKGRKFDILQIGVVFQSNKPTKEDFQSLSRVAMVSSFATVSLLYEKERYYEKAVRQSVKGSIIKCGEFTDIKNQVDILNRLRDTENWMVPTIHAADESLHINGDNLLAWYKMTRYEIPSLLDIFAFTKGFEDYEVASLIRATFGHLCSTYWGENFRSSESKVKELLFCPLALTQDVILDVDKKIESQTSNIELSLPIKLKRGINLVGRPSQTLTKVLDHIRTKTDFDLTLIWDRFKTQSLRIRNPKETVLHLKKTLETHFSESEILSNQLLVTGNGMLHGDAHFGNFLADVSVPEDAFVVSIDPVLLKIQIADATCSDELTKILGASSQRQGLQSLESDIVYDLGKILLSASCCYGLVYHGGFSIEVKARRRGNSVNFILKRKEGDGHENLDDVGGISGAQIIRVGANIPENAWNYHQTAAKIIVREYITFLHNKKELVSSSNFQQAVNVGLIRLWLITARHAFSMVRNLFPLKMEKAMVMYLLACLFLKTGTDAICEILTRDPQLVSEDTQVSLSKIFTFTS